MAPKARFYAIRRGHETGIFTSWEECKEKVNGFSRCEYKSFMTQAEAEAYVAESESPWRIPAMSNKPSGMATEQRDSHDTGPSPSRAGASPVTPSGPVSRLQMHGSPAVPCTLPYAVDLGKRRAEAVKEEPEQAQQDQKIPKQEAGVPPQATAACSKKPSAPRDPKGEGGASGREVILDSAELLDNKEERARLCQELTHLLEFGGASKGNPGRAGAGAVLSSPLGKELVQITEGVAMGTCNQAEYRALIAGLEEARYLGVKHITVTGDSLFVLQQCAGVSQVKGKDLEDLHKLAKDMLLRFDHHVLVHIPRELNSKTSWLADVALSQPDGERTVRVMDDDCKKEFSETH